MIAPGKSGQASRGGFTLIELMVVVGILAMLAALILPAVQSARESARSAVCKSNFRQLGIALHAYAGIWDCFPPLLTARVGRPDPGRVTSFFSPHSFLLPHLDQAPLYAAINFEVTGTTRDVVSPGNRTASDVSLAVFLCPSDPARHRPGAVNYRANAGYAVLAHDLGDLDRGAFTFWVSGDLATFRDGLSNTLAMCEKPIGRPGRWAAWTGRTEVGVGTVRPVTKWRYICARLPPGAAFDTHSGVSWLLAGVSHTFFLALAPPNTPIPDCGYYGVGGRGLLSARSYHPGGVNALMSDGSARWFGSNVDADLWLALSTRSSDAIAMPEP